LLGAWIWWRRLRQIPRDIQGLKETENWLAFVNRFSLQAQKTDLIVTAGNFELDRTFNFGTLYEAKVNLPREGTPKLLQGQRYFFMGIGCLPYDGILDYYFEGEDGAFTHLIFEPLRNPLADANHADMLENAWLSPVPSHSQRSRDLQIVRSVLIRLRARKDFH
jgi:hypothetical protein